MKSASLFRILPLATFAALLSALPATAETGAPKGAPKTSAWFTATEVAPKTWRIDDHNVSNTYLVIGSERALLIDTGCGAADLKAYVSSLTSLPLTVINTHGHPDHVGANYQFGAVLADPADFGAIESMSTPEVMARFAGMLNGAVVPDDEKYHDKVLPVTLSAVKDGQVIDLGGRPIEIITTPGHTVGEIVLLDRQNKLLFTGDNDNTLVWLHIPGCLPLEGYLKSLEKIQARVHEYTTLFPGHGTPIEASFVAEQIECVKAILAGTAASEPYKSFVADGRVATYKRASVVFNPANLRAAK